MAQTNKAMKAKNGLKPDRKTTGKNIWGKTRPGERARSSKFNERIQDEGQYEPLRRCHSRRQAP